MSASQLYAGHALVLDDTGRDLGAPAWHESDLVQRFPAAAPGTSWTRGRCASACGTARSRSSSIARGLPAATCAAEELPFPLPESPKLSERRFRRPRLRGRDAHDWRPPDGPARPRAGSRGATRCSASTRRARTRAGSSRAATAAVSPPPSFSAGSPRRRARLDRLFGRVGAERTARADVVLIGGQPCGSSEGRRRHGGADHVPAADSSRRAACRRSGGGRRERRGPELADPEPHLASSTVEPT